MSVAMIFAVPAGLWEVGPQTPDAPTLCLEVSGLAPDAGTLDVLARLSLVLGRCGYRLELRGAPRELTDLIALAGLSDVLPGADQSRLD
jgi:ABC-type transporter Mla MlaB component